MYRRLLRRSLLATVCCSGMWTGSPALGAEDGPTKRVAFTLPGYRVVDYLNYRIDGSKVALFGQVTRPLVRDDAEKAAQSIEGVNSVDNQIEMLPASQLDDRIRFSVYRAIYSKTPLEKHQMGTVPPIRQAGENYVAI
jgi:hypothetical protein